MTPILSQIPTLISYVASSMAPRSWNPTLELSKARQFLHRWFKKKVSNPTIVKAQATWPHEKGEAAFIAHRLLLDNVDPLQGKVPMIFFIKLIKQEKRKEKKKNDVATSVNYGVAFFSNWFKSIYNPDTSNTKMRFLPNTTASFQRCTGVDKPAWHLSISRSRPLNE